MPDSLNIPSSLTPGETFEAVFNDANYQSPEWEGILSLGSEKTVINIPSGPTSQVTAFRFFASAAETGNWESGIYVWAVKVIRKSDNFTKYVEKGVLQIDSDPTKPATDRQQRLDRARKDIANIDVMLSGIASSGVSSYTIGRMSVSKYQISELLAFRRELENKINVLKRGSRTFERIILRKTG